MLQEVFVILDDEGSEGHFHGIRFKLGLFGMQIQDSESEFFTGLSLETRILPDLVTTVASELYERLSHGGNFGFPTGRTMDPIYARLVELHQQRPLNPARIQAFMVDEYVGLASDNPQSYSFYLQQRVFGPLGITRVHRVTEQGYDELIHAQGGLDLQILGLGPNGHIGFNEPGSLKSSRTRRVTIAEATRQANAALFSSIDEVPTHAVSIGVSTILSAREIWVIASGASKAKIVRDLRDSVETSELPASFLKSHPASVLMLDAAAAGLLH